MPGSDGSSNDAGVTAGPDRLHALLVGAFAGVLNGLIALGGGLVVTPMLLRRGIAPQVAVGTALAVVTILSTLGFAAHYATGTLVIGVAPIAIAVTTGIVGSIFGSRVLASITPRWMLLAFALLVASVALRLIAQGAGLLEPTGTQGAGASLLAYAGYGFFAGTMSGVFGVGGGALVLLALATFHGVPVKEGLSVALALNITNALAGLIHHARAGRVLLNELRWMAPTAVIGVGIGAWLAQILPADILRMGFGGFFLWTGWKLARQGLAKARCA